MYVGLIVLEMTKTRNVGKLTKNGTIEKIVDVCACPDQYILSPYFATE